MGSEYDIMLDEKDEKISALKAELELTRKALRMLAEKLTVYTPACVRCCAYWTAPHHCTCGKPDGATCADGIAAWAMEKAKEEQR